jgi:hypothetical protein
MAKALNGEAMAKKGPWAGSKVVVKSFDLGDGFEVPCWVLLHPGGGWAVVRMQQGARADALRGQWQEEQQAKRDRAAEVMAERYIEKSNESVTATLKCKVCGVNVSSYCKLSHFMFGEPHGADHSAIMKLQARVEEQQGQEQAA